MSPFEIYSLVICLIVYILLAGIGTFMVLTVYKLLMELIRKGARDQEILKEHLKQKGKKKTCAFDCISSILLCSVLLIVFVFSTYVGCTKNTYFDNAPTFKIVNSSSMSKKNEKNKYLFENNLNNQFSTFDLILTYKLPKEEELKLYDIVIYEVDDVLVVHRIVGIEEPNKHHPEERWFLCQGDAISQPDRFPVKYSQMRGIYKNEKIPFVGSFVAFMQSPAGYMCIILVALAVVLTPILEKKLEKAKQLRLALMLPQEEIATTQDQLSPFSSFDRRRDERTFAERLQELPVAQERYEQLYSLIKTITGVRRIESKKSRTFKSGNIPLIKFAIRGKTLNAYLGLDPKEYENTKYIYTDVSDMAKYRNYPMRVKVTSDRQVRWVKELLTDKVHKSGLTFVEEQEIVEDVSPFAHLKRKKNKTFKQKLKSAPLASERFQTIKTMLETLRGVRVIEGKYQVSYKFGNHPLIRFTVRGKTLNAYLGLDPKEYENTKYIYTDVSDTAKYRNYPMRVKVTSDRQVRWVKELILQAFNKGGKQL